MSAPTVYDAVEAMAKACAKTVAAAHATVISKTTNIRAAGDVSSTRALPGISIDCLANKAIPGDCVEYHGVMEWNCETKAPIDTTGDNVDQLVGAVRDMLNDGNFLASMNVQGVVQGIVFHEFREAQTVRDDDEEGKIRRRVVQADFWCYPGAVS